MKPEFPDTSVSYCRWYWNVLHGERRNSCTIRRRISFEYGIKRSQVFAHAARFFNGECQQFRPVIFPRVGSRTFQLPTANKKTDVSGNSGFT